MYKSLCERIVRGEEKISLVGLGYVGMPIAVAFAKKVKVVGYDLNKAKIDTSQLIRINKNFYNRACSAVEMHRILVNIRFLPARSPVKIK